MMDAPEAIRPLFGSGVAGALRNLRRDLHRHPELSWHEEGTALRLTRALNELGVADVTRVAGTGLIARVPGRVRTGGAVAVRGDIDALPITESTNLPFTSETAGVMHACGHDVHASWAVGAARLLVDHPAQRDVLVILQPAEEVGEGARAILDSGAIDDARMIFGAHVDRRFEVGQVVAQAGPLAASTDSFSIALAGAGAHGARPHESSDPIVGAAALVSALQTLVSRRLDPAEPGVVTVGTIAAGSASNIIPDRALLTGTIRATTTAARALLTRELERMANAIAGAYGLTATVEITGGTPPIVNPPEMAELAREAVTRVLGAHALVPLGTTNMGGEDFAAYMERIPGCFMRVGAREPGSRAIPAHSPAFYADEGALFVGAAVLAEAARIGAQRL
ncbi:MAG TPA: M20 family metallopeptidase [Gemmatimonadaceae bacterium]|nr:M20 family metallopeptidase [Gemmatimonadaceae bacterium]